MKEKSRTGSSASGNSGLRGLGLAGAGPHAGTQQLLHNGTQRMHLVRIEPVHHPIQVDLRRAHCHEPRAPSAWEAPTACVAGGGPGGREPAWGTGKGSGIPCAGGDWNPSVSMSAQLSLVARYADLCRARHKPMTPAQPQKILNSGARDRGRPPGRARRRGPAEDLRALHRRLG
jgi:hypothetical protein